MILDHEYIIDDIYDYSFHIASVISRPPDLGGVIRPPPQKQLDITLHIAYLISRNVDATIEKL